MARNPDTILPEPPQRPDQRSVNTGDSATQPIEPDAPDTVTYDIFSKTLGPGTAPGTGHRVIAQGRKPAMHAPADTPARHSRRPARG